MATVGGGAPFAFESMSAENLAATADAEADLQTRAALVSTLGADASIHASVKAPRGLRNVPAPNALQPASGQVTPAATPAPADEPDFDEAALVALASPSGGASTLAGGSSSRSGAGTGSGRSDGPVSGTGRSTGSNTSTGADTSAGSIRDGGRATLAASSRPATRSAADDHAANARRAAAILTASLLAIDCGRAVRACSTDLRVCLGMPGVNADEVEIGVGGGDGADLDDDDGIDDNGGVSDIGSDAVTKQSSAGGQGGGSSQRWQFGDNTSNSRFHHCDILLRPLSLSAVVGRRQTLQSRRTIGARAALFASGLSACDDDNEPASSGSLDGSENSSNKSRDAGSCSSDGDAADSGAAYRAALSEAAWTRRKYWLAVRARRQRLFEVDKANNLLRPLAAASGSTVAPTATAAAQIDIIPTAAVSRNATAATASKKTAAELARESSLSFVPPRAVAAVALSSARTIEPLKSPTSRAASGNPAPAPISVPAAEPAPKRPSPPPPPPPSQPVAAGAASDAAVSLPVPSPPPLAQSATPTVQVLTNSDTAAGTPSEGQKLQPAVTPDPSSSNSTSAAVPAPTAADPSPSITPSPVNSATASDTSIAPPAPAHVPLVLWAAAPEPNPTMATCVCDDAPTPSAIDGAATAATTVADEFPSAFPRVCYVCVIARLLDNWPTAMFEKVCAYA